MLYDLTAIDERTRVHREGQPASDFTVSITCCPSSATRTSASRSRSLRDDPPAADHHRHLALGQLVRARDLGHVRHRLRRPSALAAHPDAAHLAEAIRCARTIRRAPPRWGRSACRKTRRTPSRKRCASIRKSGACGVRMTAPISCFSTWARNHPGTHGVFRIVLQLDGEEIVDAVPDIGFHHRGAEKMGERQSWHTYIPYTDRVDYLGGVMNNLPYVLAVEKLAGIEVPDRVKVIRVMMAELFRITSHLVFYGTLRRIWARCRRYSSCSPTASGCSISSKPSAADACIRAGFASAAWRRICRKGWDRLVRDFLDYLPPRLDEYDRIVLGNSIFKARTEASAAIQLDEAIEWGVTGPGLRACGFEWDFRKARPYSGYDQFEFDIPTGQHGDCYDRCAVRVEEMRQSLRIIEQCLNNMPAGPYKADHPLDHPAAERTTPCRTSRP